MQCGLVLTNRDARRKYSANWNWRAARVELDQYNCSFISHFKKKIFTNLFVFWVHRMILVWANHLYFYSLVIGLHETLEYFSLQTTLEDLVSPKLSWCWNFLVSSY